MSIIIFSIANALNLYLSRSPIDKDKQLNMSELTGQITGIVTFKKLHCNFVALPPLSVALERYVVS